MRSCFPPYGRIALFFALALLLAAGSARAQFDVDSGPAISPSYAGIDINQQANEFAQTAWPPSPNAAVGTQHVVEVTNQTLAIYIGVGQRISHFRLRDFLKTTVGGVTYQATFDPRVLFDARTQRFYMACVAIGNGASALPDPVILAVSRSANAVGAWDKYVVPLGDPAVGNDLKSTGNLTLGIDSTALYFTARIFPSKSAEYCKIAATKLAPLLAARPSLGEVKQFSKLDGLVASPIAATNFDASGDQWFAASAKDSASGARLFKMTWTGGTPSLSAPINLLTPTYAKPVDASQKGSPTLLDTGDERILSAVVRNGRLYVSRTIGVNSTGGSSSPDRSACEWMEVNVSGAQPALTQTGRVFGAGNTNPLSYFIPTLSVNSASDVVLGFSGSSATTFLSAYFCNRFHTDPVNTLSPLQTLKAGAASYVREVGDDTNPVGRYGSVAIDPNNDFAFWTCQSYATATPDSWGTWISRIQAGEPPALPGKAKVKPAKLAFGKVKSGKSKTMSFTISSIGDHPLIGNVGAASAPYAVTVGAGEFDLAPRAKLKVTVQFSPVKRGAAPSVVTVTTNDPDHPSVEVKLTGSGK